jgi:hypothetical protein
MARRRADQGVSDIDGDELLPDSACDPVLLNSLGLRIDIELASERRLRRYRAGWVDVQTRRKVGRRHSDHVDRLPDVGYTCM